MQEYQVNLLKATDWIRENTFIGIKIREDLLTFVSVQCNTFTAVHDNKI